MQLGHAVVEPIMNRTRELRRHGIRSTDPAEITSYLSRLYGANMRLELKGHRHGERIGLDHRRFDGGGFALEDVRHEGDVETRGEATSGVVVLWPTEGRAESRAYDHEGGANVGEMVLGSTASAPIRLRTCDVAMKTVVVERFLLTKAAADLAPKPALVRFSDVRPISSEAARALTATRRYVEETFLADDGAAAAFPLVLAGAGRLLAAAVLSAFPNTAGAGESPHDRNDHRPVLLRRAMAYLEEHVAEDIGVADVASAVYVTPRALQYMFRRHLETTPMAYLRRVRLDRVHRDLVAGDRASTTVTATAAQWGFAHVGRFAVLYRETYGESPHVTLRC
jgi:AraC-like DNA-binding protein